MSGGRSGGQPASALPVVAAAALVVAGALGGCAASDAPAGQGAASVVTTSAGLPASDSSARRMRGGAAAIPSSVEQLGRLVVEEVPSGLPRMPDAALQPPAGPKGAAEVAAYADDPDHEREVLERYGFRYGWERFWGRGSGPVTSVFLEQFDDPAGAETFTADLARNDAEHYRASLHEHPPELPAGCLLLTADRAEPDVRLDGPAAFAWCASGTFSVAVTSVAGSGDAAVEEVSAVVRDQLARLPSP